MASPKKGASPYNQYAPKKGDNFERSWKPTEVREVTVRALEELESISTWAEFVKICEEQKRKRGW